MTTQAPQIAQDAPTPISSLDDLPQERALKPAMLRGLRCRCPSCGRGPILFSYLKVRDTCPVCQEELFHHRADDGPAYLTITIVGHLAIPLLGWTFVKFRPDPMTLIAIFSVFSVGLSLLMLPRLKGMIIGFQWAKRMNGFSADSSGKAQSKS